MQTRIFQTILRQTLLIALVLAMSAVAFATPFSKAQDQKSSQNSASSQSTVRPYQDLIIPEAIEGTKFELNLHKATRSFWKGATTKTYAYNKNSYWGPTLIMNKGDEVSISVKNELDEDTSSHWHGLHIPARMDGGPHQIIPPGKTWTPTFTVNNSAATYWYHPHIHGTTQRQLTMGAGGFIIVRDKNESTLALPRTYGVDDIPIALGSRRFYKDNEFSHEGDNDKYGDYLFANGVLDAQVSLPSQFVRLRLLNVEVERGYIVGFSDDRPFYQIATDGGLVDKPVALKRITLMPGERAEILVDLSKDKVGSSLDLRAYNANQPFGFPGGENGTGRPNGSYLNNRNFNLLHINVAASTAKAITSLPTQLTHNKFWTEADVTNRRTLKINGQPGSPFTFDDGGVFKMATVSHQVKLGAVEAWTIVNNRVFGHAFHIHDVQFKIVSRSSGPVPAYEQGWKDTLYIFRDETVTFIAKFEDFADDTAPYMYHCHMSNHEDEGLMGQFLVRKDTSLPLPTVPEHIVKGQNGEGNGSQITFRDQVEHPLTTAMALAANSWSKTVAPNFTTTDVTGKSLSLTSLTNGKPLLLFFVEAKCPCSRDAAPFIDRIHALYGDSVNVVGVVAGQSDVASAWAKKLGVRFRVIADPKQQIIKAYGAKRAAYTTLIGADGRVIKTYPGYGREMLQEIANRVSQQSIRENNRQINLAQTLTKFQDAPNRLVVGCSFPTE